MARSALPWEACGLLAGSVGPSPSSEGRDGVGAGEDLRVVRVEAIHSVANSLRSPTSFALDGEEMMAAERAIDAAGQALVGVWHSHPTSAAAPSPRDLEDARRYDPNAGFVQVIVSMQGFSASVRAFRYDPDGGAPRELDVILSA